MGLKTYTREKYLKLYTGALLTVWTIILISILILKIASVKETTEDLAINEARAHFNRDKALRSWAASHGGVYVPVDETTPPNQYLSHIPERDIQTPSGKALTLMNPAYMMRQVNEYFSRSFGITGHITSLKLLRPQNAPDEWETKALKSFEQGASEHLEFTMLDDKPYLRLMQPLFVTNDCLKCHAHQGYKTGEVRGGVSISVPMASYLSREKHEIIEDSATLALLWLMGLIGIILGERGLKRRIRERDEAQKELQKYHDDLELLVEKRTVELKEANKHLQSEITERKRAEEQIKKSLAEKEVLMKEIHHRVKNNMTVVSSLLNLQSKKIGDERYREMFRDSMSRIKTMASVHERLYQSDNLSKIIFSDYIKDMADNIFKSYGASPRIKLITDIQRITLGIDASIPCGLIVNELITNAIKYAFPEGREGEIRVSLRTNDRDEIELMVNDNGVGMPEGLDIRSTGSLGLNLVDALVKQLRAKMELNNEGGTRFEITFRRG